MKKPSLLLVLCMFVASQPVTGKEMHGIDVPDTISLQGSSDTLVLNGAGLREKFFKDIYVGALYLPEKNPDELAITSDTGPAGVDMHIIHSEISKQKITDGWEDGLKANINQKELETFRPRLDQFNKMFKPVRKGDVIRISYSPGTGTEVRINGEWRGAVEGNDFYRALLKIWLGPRPVSKSLKKGMLGLD